MSGFDHSHLCTECSEIRECGDGDCADVTCMPCPSCIADAAGDEPATERLIVQAVHFSGLPEIVRAFRLHLACRRGVEQ